MNLAHARAVRLFPDYLDLSASARDKALARLRGEDPEAYAVLSAMLRAHAKPHAIDHPLHASLLQDDDEGADATQDRGDARIGSRLGPWQIDRIIAEGGMGTVYEAHRDDGHYRQRVALKCIRAGLDTPALVEAFQAERDHLARLEHPHIATLLDGGVDATGAPWFAMRYVEGQPIDQWCDQRRLPLEARMRLLLQACDALAYAHQQNILHQDLKPSNLLVTAQGQAQLLDFGLSTALASDGRAKPLAISVGYTAPEILHHAAAPHFASDIYSLGQIMARLVCGTAPIRALLAQTETSVGLPQLAREAPTGTARVRGLDSESELARHLDGDLDAIFARSTRFDPQQRYRCVGEFAEDLRRWLDGRPVHAREGGSLYRSRRFLYRHRIVAGLVGLIVLSSIIGIGTSLWLQQRAIRQAHATRNVARLFEQTLGTATLSGLSETRFSSLSLLRKTEAQVRAMDLDGEPEVMAQALGSLARSYAVIGDYRHATDLAAEAARLQGPGHIPSADTQATLASLLNLQARYAEARRVAERALATLPQDDDTQPIRLRLMTEIARSRWDLGEREQARELIDSALALAKPDVPQDPRPSIELLTLRGSWSLRILELASAAQDLDKAIRLAEPGHPDLLDTAREYRAHVYVQTEDPKHARQLAQEVLDSRRRRLGEDHPETGRAWTALAGSQYLVGEGKAARESALNAMRILRNAYGEQHPYSATALRGLAILGYREGTIQYEPALAQIRRSRAIMHRAYPPAHEEAMRADSFLGIWLLSAPPGPLQEAHTDEGIALLESLYATAQRNHVPLVFGKLTWAVALMQRNRPGDVDRAKALVREAKADVDRYFGPSHSSYVATGMAEAKIEYVSGNLAAADAMLQSFVPRIVAQLPRNNARISLCESMKLRATIASRQGEPARAREFLRQLQKAGRGESGLSVWPACNEEAEQALRELTRTGRYRWSLS